MHVQTLKLSKHLTDLLVDAGLTTVEHVQHAGRAGLIAIDGIGPASADDILAAAEQLSAPTVEETAPPPATPSAAPPPTPTERVSVRNASDVPVLVGGKYLFPGDVRVIRRDQMKAGLAAQRAGA